MKPALLLCVLLLAACAGSAKKGVESKVSASTDLEAAKAEKIAETSVAIQCQSNKETRLLTNRSLDKGCEVEYERNGEKMVAASAKNDPTHCAKVAERIRGNLEKAGFRCK
jgi:hypothetical protein